MVKMAERSTPDNPAGRGRGARGGRRGGGIGRREEKEGLEGREEAICWFYRP